MVYYDIQYGSSAVIELTMLCWLVCVCTKALNTFVFLLVITCSCLMLTFSFSPIFHRFPLYPRGERFHFEYGVYLLNKNIAQVIHEHTFPFYLRMEKCPGCHIQQLSDVCHGILYRH